MKKSEREKNSSIDFVTCKQINKLNLKIEFV